MTFKRSVLAAAFAVAIGAPAVGSAVTLSSSGPGRLSGSFTQAVDGLFIDTIDFTPAAIGGLVSVVLTSSGGPVSFFTASLNDQNFSFFPELGASDFRFTASFANAGPLTLTVFGAVLDSDGNVGGAGSYRGTVDVMTALAVPEPSTWALLGLGLGALGLAARKRRHT